MSRLPGYYPPDEPDVYFVDGWEHSESQLDDLCNEWEEFLKNRRKEVIAEVIGRSKAEPEIYGCIPEELAMDANDIFGDFDKSAAPCGWEWFKEYHGEVGVLAPITAKEIEEAANA